MFDCWQVLGANLILAGLRISAVEEVLLKKQSGLQTELIHSFARKYEGPQVKR